MKKLFNHRISKFSMAICLVVIFSCSKDDGCGYTAADDIIPVGCTQQTSIDMSTGVDADGNRVEPALDVVDLQWRVLNNPPLLFCDNNPFAGSINGNAYLINFSNLLQYEWVNQPGTTTLAPMNLGPNAAFGCNNATNDDGGVVPYVFERSFCVLKNTAVDFDFTFKGDDQLKLELINNITNQVIQQSSLYIYPQNAMSFTATNLSLSAGSYSIRAYLANTSSVVLGFSVKGNIHTTAGDEAISNNNLGCCENNTISILNLIDVNCNQKFDTGDHLAKNWTVRIKNSSNQVIRTATTDANGNIFFSGLSNGTYTVELVPQTGFTSSTTTANVTLTDNAVKIVEFYNCPQ